MIVVAGPPGSGKSTNFPLVEYGYDWFKGTKFDIASVRESLQIKAARKSTGREQ